MLALHPGAITAIIVVGLVTFGVLFPFVAGFFLDITKGNETCENCRNWLSFSRRRTARFISTSSRRNGSSGGHATVMSEVSASGVSRRDSEVHEERSSEGEPENPELSAHAPPSYNEAAKCTKEEEVEDLPPEYNVDPDLPPYPSGAKV